MAFVDFEKAFDSVHRPTMWRILRNYGMPGKYIRLIEEIHKGSICRVSVDGQLFPEFNVESWVLQDLDYANDVVLMSRSIQNLQTIVSRLEEKGKGAGVTINVRKTEVMKADQEFEGNIEVQDQIMGEVPVFKYLGTLVKNQDHLQMSLGRHKKRSS
ncbi:uncharacterized protein LOC121858151, partial [Homarus americanus]|uniref:uncharacterized protein LOC121858151 n=1 Tax=Homarus americanus TaxID=6706 RepID=UPI001C446EC3